LLLPTVPFLVLPLALLFDQGRAGLRTTLGRITVALIAFTFLINLATIPYPQSRYYLLKDFAQRQGQHEWWSGSLILKAIADLPELVLSGANKHVNDPSRQFLLSFPNSINMLRLDVWIFKAPLFGIPMLAVEILAAGLLLLLGFAIWNTYKVSPEMLKAQPDDGSGS
jgi:hypothetical protein